MTKKELNKANKEFESKKPKASTLTVKGTVTEKQGKIIRGLIGTIGSNEQDVVGKILTIWLYNEGYLKEQ